MWPDYLYYITVLIYCCVLTVYNTLRVYKFVNTERDGLCQTEVKDCLDGRIILISILREGVIALLGFIWLRIWFSGGCRDYTNGFSGSVKCRDYIGRLGKYHLSGFETLTTVLMKIQVCETSLGRGCNYITGTHLNKLEVLNFDCLLLGETCVCA